MNGPAFPALLSASSRVIPFEPLAPASAAERNSLWNQIRESLSGPAIRALSSVFPQESGALTWQSLAAQTWSLDEFQRLALPPTSGLDASMVLPTAPVERSAPNILASALDATTGTSQDAGLGTWSPDATPTFAAPGFSDFGNSRLPRSVETPPAKSAPATSPSPIPYERRRTPSRRSASAAQTSGAFAVSVRTILSACQAFLRKLLLSQ